MKIVIRALLLATFIPSIISSSFAFTTKAKQAILIDVNTGLTLFEKNADQLMTPSSMTKIMTVYLAFEQLKKNKLKLNDTLPVSENAWRKGGSRMFVGLGSHVTVQDLLRGIIIQSGNDASIVIAEGIAGDEAAFAKEMTSRAHDLGAKNTTFTNATGWPDPTHLTTARDLAIISERIIKDFPHFYPLFKEVEFTYNNIRQGNRNPLLYKNLGVDGLKTGQTDEGGYGLVASALRGHQRVIMVINGLKTMKERAQESEALISWGFRNFLSLRLFKAGEPVINTPVWLGKSSTVEMAPSEDVYYTIPRDQIRNLKVTVRYLTPIPAPVRPGQIIGSLIVQCPNTPSLEVPLKAVKEVTKADFLTRIQAALHYLFWGHNTKKV